MLKVFKIKIQIWYFCYNKKQFKEAFLKHNILIQYNTTNLIIYHCWPNDYVQLLFIHNIKSIRSPLVIAAKSVSLFVRIRKSYYDPTTCIHNSLMAIQNLVFARKKLFRTSKSPLTQTSIKLTATNTVVYDWKV